MVKLGKCLISYYTSNLYDLFMEVKNDLILENRTFLLTSRKTEYLSLVTLGCKNKRIANILYVSLSTVKKTFENIFKELNAKDRANAVAIVFTHNIINTKILADIKSKYKLD